MQPKEREGEKLTDLAMGKITLQELAPAEPFGHRGAQQCRPSHTTHGISQRWSMHSLSNADISVAGDFLASKA